LKPATLALADGTLFTGFSFGADGHTTGEVVFTTGMTGYQEVLTDPSFKAQIVTMTAVQIGNYGINAEDVESSGPMVAGFVVRALSPVASSWRSTGCLSDYLARADIPGLQEIDTRALTKKLRVDGAMKACLSTEGLSDTEAISRAKAGKGIVGADCVKDTACVALRVPWMCRAIRCAASFRRKAPTSPSSSDRDNSMSTSTSFASWSSSARATSCASAKSLPTRGWGSATRRSRASVAVTASAASPSRRPDGTTSSRARRCSTTPRRTT